MIERLLIAVVIIGLSAGLLPAQGGNVVLSEKDYCRAWYQYGHTRIDPAARRSPWLSSAGPSACTAPAAATSSTASSPRGLRPPSRGWADSQGSRRWAPGKGDRRDVV